MSKFSRSARPISRASERSSVPSLFVSNASSSFCFVAESPAGALSAGVSAAGLSAGSSVDWAYAGKASNPRPRKVSVYNRKRMICLLTNAGSYWPAASHWLIWVCRSGRTSQARPPLKIDFRCRLEHSVAVGDMSLHQIQPDVSAGVSAKILLAKRIFAASTA
jgi:hypothetical protein